MSRIFFKISVISILLLNSCQTANSEISIQKEEGQEVCSYRKYELNDKDLEEQALKYIELFYMMENKEALEMTYEKALPLFFGNRNYAERIDGKDSYCASREDYIAAGEKMNRRNTFKERGTNFNFYIHNEVFNYKNDTMEFKLLDVSENPIFKDGEIDINTALFCIKKNNVWKFFENNLSPYQVRKIDRREVLCSFIKEEGLTDAEVAGFKEKLYNYKFSPFAVYSAKNDLENGLVSGLVEWQNALKGFSENNVKGYMYPLESNSIGEKLMDKELSSVRVNYQEYFQKLHGEEWVVNVADMHRILDSKGKVVYKIDYTTAIRQKPAKYLVNKHQALGFKLPTTNHLTYLGVNEFELGLMATLSNNFSQEEIEIIKKGLQ